MQKCAMSLEGILVSIVAERHDTCIGNVLWQIVTNPEMATFLPIVQRFRA